MDRFRGAPSPELVLTHHGHLTLARMLELMRPGALDPSVIVGRRVRWTYTTSRRENAETKLASEELKQLHLQMGAAEVIVHRGPWAPDPD